LPRYHRVEDIIQLALALQVPGPGLCLEDIQQRFAVGRRTAERMREAVDRIYPGMTSTKDPDGRKYWRLEQGEANALVAWLPEKVEALVAGAGAAGAEGPAPVASTGPLDALQHAIVLEREVILRRRRDGSDAVTSRMKPYGLLGGPRPLLVAVHAGQRGPRLVPVLEIEGVEPLDAPFERDPNLDLRRYAANAFLPFEEEALDLCWRFGPESADDALEYEFHPEQQIELRDDGSVDVRFRLESLVVLAWHLFTWGDRVESRERPVLKHRFNAMTRRALEARPARGRGTPADDADEAREPGAGP